MWRFRSRAPRVQEDPPQLYGEKTPHYELTVRDDAKEVTVQVRDDGVTITSKERGKFWRIPLAIAGAILLACIAHAVAISVWNFFVH